MSIDVEEEVRRCMQDLADQARPADLGPGALVRARRRRRARSTAVAVTAAAAVLAVVATAQLASPSHAPPVVAGPVPSGPSGNVVTTYTPEANSAPRLLNPRTGEYYPASRLLGEVDTHSGVFYSPNLEWVAVAWNRKLHVAAADPGRDIAQQQIAIPGLRGLSSPSWSPDSARVSLWAPSAARDGFSALSEVAVAELATGEADLVDLELPTGHTALAPIPRDLAWWDAHHLAVSTTDQKYKVDGPGDFGLREQVPTALSVFDLSGNLVDQLPINQQELFAADDPHAGLMWRPYGPVRDGRVLLTRQPEPATLELAVVDLATDPGPYRSVTVTVPPVELPEPRPAESGSIGVGGVWHQVITPDGWLHPDLYVHAWLPDGQALVASSGHSLHFESQEVFVVPVGHYLVDLGSGDLRQVELPVPYGWGWLTFGDSGLLAPGAASQAITL